MDTEQPQSAPIHPDISPSLSKKEKRELHRTERRDAQRAQTRRARMRRTGKIVFALFAAGGLLAGVTTLFLRFSAGQLPSGIDYSVPYPIQGRDHIAPGAPRPNYNSDPPTSGAHYPQPASRGVHNEELSDEQLLHNLEHGEVWIAYRPNLKDEVIDELKRITRRNTKVVLAPRARNSTDITLAAWGRLDTFNIEQGALDVQRIEDFITRYRNKGPELVP